MQSGENLIQVQKVSKNYNNISALNNISLDILLNEAMLILGPSGCGKTTFLRLIAGLENPDEGKIYINEQLVSTDDYVIPPHQRGLGFVFQDLALWPHMSVYKNVEFSLSMVKMDWKEKKKRVNRILEQLKLHHKTSQYPGQLSGGEQQRVAIARALVLDSPLILMDEPFASLDPILIKDLVSIVKELKMRKNKTIILVTQIINHINELADRCVVLSEGQISQIGTLSELKKNPANEFVKHFINI